MEKNIARTLKEMRIAFLKGSIKKKAFSHYALGDFKRELKKLKKEK